MGGKLFDDEDSCNDDEKLNQIKINEEYARRLEYNKKREDLQRLEELKKKGVISDDEDSEEEESSEEEEDDLKESKKKDVEFFEALIKVRNKDPVLKMKDAKLFESDDESGHSDDGNEKAKMKRDGNNDKKKPAYLKDVVSKHLIEEGPEFDDSEDSEDNSDGDMAGQNKGKSYLEEQEELRNEFLKAVEEADIEEDEGELLKEKSKKDVDEDDEFGIGNKLDEYFGSDEKLDEGSMFLKDYFKNRLWMRDDGDKSGGMDEDGFPLRFSEDEEEIEKQEDYEREFNFRFEENAGDRVMGHSRVMEGSVRKKANARKLQRERKEERKEQAEFERKEELKHLKNLKKKEIKEKLQKIKEAAGLGDDGTLLFDEHDLEDEFDEEEYDKKMKEAFDEEYYEADDIDAEFGSDKEEDGDLEKPDFDKEDELLGLPKGWDDVNKSSDGFRLTREKLLKLKAENGVEQIEQSVGEDVEDEDGKRKKKRKRQASEVEKAVRDQLLEEYYKLDYEDTVGDLKTRFKYKTVNPKRYGLTTEEIMMLDDKELNQYIPLKKLAPYRDKEWKVPHTKAYQQKQRIKELLQGETSKPHNKFKGVDDQQKSVERNSERETPQAEEVNNNTNKLSRKGRRKLRKAELKIPNSRLLAYGKIPSKAEKKKKS